jgi:hypothetical protein
MPKYIAATHSEGKNYRLKKLNGVLTEFTVDGKKVEPGMEEYADILDQFAMLEKTVVANELRERTKGSAGKNRRTSGKTSFSSQKT